MNLIQKTLLPLSLCLCLTACGAGGSAAPAPGAVSAEAAASVAGADSAKSTVEEGAGALEKYAQSLNTLYGQDYPGYMTQDHETQALVYDSSQVPNEVLGWTVADLDGDGAQELLCAALNDDHSFRLDLYTEQKGAVSKTDTLDLRDEFAALPAIIGTKDSQSIADFFTCRGPEGGLQVGLEMSQTAGTFVDGVKLDFYAVSCQDKVLRLEHHASTSGSDGLYSTRYMDELAALGFYPSWSALFRQDSYVREGAQEYQDFARVTTRFPLEGDEGSAWLSGGAEEPLECAAIHISSQQELEQNTQTLRAAWQAPREHAAALQKYESALMDFFLDQVWPDGSKLEEEPDFATFYDNHYAIADVDADGEPELLLQYSETYVAAQMERVYHYDADSGTLREELAVYPFCTYYDNGVVKAFAAHNQTPSDFWPYTLYQYSAESHVFEEQGSVYAQDKDSPLFEATFPAEADKDGDARVFYFGTDEAVDNDVFEAWEQSYLADASELELEWKTLNPDNFETILSE